MIRIVVFLFFLWLLAGPFPSGLQGAGGCVAWQLPLGEADEPKDSEDKHLEDYLYTRAEAWQTDSGAGSAHILRQHNALLPPHIERPSPPPDVLL